MACDSFQINSSGKALLNNKIPLIMCGTGDKKYLISNALFKDVINNSDKGIAWLLERYQNKEHSIYGVIGTERKPAEEKIKEGYRGIAGEISQEQKESSLKEILNSWIFPNSVPKNWFSN